MRSVLDCDVRIWPKGCKSCGGDLRFEDDPQWRRYVCYQCGRPTPVPGQWSHEEIVDPFHHRQDRRPETY